MDTPKRKRTLSIKEMSVFALFGGLMFVSIQANPIPNVHPLALFIATLTVVYRKKALIPIYLFIMLEGLLHGFALWWLPYLYIWAVLWGAIMLLPKKMPEKVAIPVISVICGLHGILFGVLYSPFQFFVYCNCDFKQTAAWIAAGLPFDISHAIGDVCASLLTIPLARLLCTLERKPYPFKVKVK